jgi:DNA-binding NarL/FixJ family response regulator
MIDEIKILIADDHPIFRGGLRSIVEKEAGFRVIAEADDGRAALDQIIGLRPDIAILDLDMPEMDGFAVARELAKSDLSTRIVILTMHKDELHFNQAVDLGIRGYLIKDGAAAEAVGCVKAILAGQEYFSPALTSYLMNRLRRVSGQETTQGLADLTPTERRVVYLLAQLKTSKEIAADLGVSPRTVENHRAHICAKLDLQGSHALTKFALQHKNDLG